MTCMHPLGFTMVRADGILRCFDCEAPCPGRCVCGSAYRSMACQHRGHLRGPQLKESA